MMTPQPNTGCIKHIHHMSVHSDTSHMQVVGWMQKGGFTTHSTSARWPLLNKQQIVKKCLRGLTKPTVVAATRQDSDMKTALPCRYIHTRENLHLGATALSTKGIAAL